MFISILLIVGCGKETYHGDSTVRIYQANIASDTLDQGIIVYGYNTIDGRTFSFSIPDTSGTLAYEIPNGPGYRFMAIGAKTASSGANADFQDLYCSEGLNPDGGKFFNLDGTPADIALSLSSAKCNAPEFNAAQFQDPSGFNKFISFWSCQDISNVSTYSGIGCSPGNYGSYRIEHIAFQGEKSAGTKLSVYRSQCIVDGADTRKTFAGDTDFPFFTRVIGFASATDCSNTFGTKIFEFPRGLGAGGPGSNVQSDPSNIRIFLSN